MKITTVPNSFISPNCRNNVYAHIYRQTRNTSNIAFTANIKNLNRAVFEQRNIIKPSDNLEQFIENIFNKIYKHDTGIGSTLITNSNYEYLLEMYHPKDLTPNLEHADLHKYMKSLIPIGIAYQEQALNAINKVRSKIYDIVVSYGFDPEELGDRVIEKSNIYKKFDELLNDASIEKKSQHGWDILVLPDKKNPDTIIEFSRKQTPGRDAKMNNTYAIGILEMLYKDSKIFYRDYIGSGDNTKITTEDGNVLVFNYQWPRDDWKYKASFNGCDHMYLVSDEKIKSLIQKPLIVQKSYVNPIYIIKDFTNDIIYYFKNFNDADELLCIQDIKKKLLLINDSITKNTAKNLTEDTKIALGTSLYTNLLQPKKPMGACVVLPYDIKKDQNAIKQELEPHILNGVGTGFDLSETNEPVKVLKSLNETLKEYDSKTQRPPAGIAILDVTHSDIFEFINAKRNVNFDDWRFNISISVPNDFMQKVADNRSIQLKNGKEVPAKSIYSAIIDSMHYCGEPGIVFKDNVEAANPLPNHRYKGMASCAEIGLEDGEMCLFSHINLNKFFNKTTGKIDFKAMGQATKNLARLLDNVIDINLAEKVGENNIASQKRRFGIGVCGFADLLADMKVQYGSKESQRILANCLEVINYHSKEASMELARERGKFPLFDESRYNEQDFLIKHSFNSPISISLWSKLYRDIQKYGLRNATTTALPPTGSSSRIIGASYSIEPYFDLRNNPIFYRELNKLYYYLTEQERQEVMAQVKKTGSCQNIEHLPEWFYDIFKVGNEIDYKKHLAMVGIAQKFVDDGISKTINFPNDATIEDIDDAVKMAYNLHLKGISVFRDGCLDERKA